MELAVLKREGCNYCTKLLSEGKPEVPGGRTPTFRRPHRPRSTFDCLPFEAPVIRKMVIITYITKPLETIIHVLRGQLVTSRL